MSRTVCSWCKAPLVLKDDILVCSNTDCPACDEKYLHEELIRTRKALAIASDLMKIMYNNLPNGNRWKWEIEKTLEQIKTTMQEQPNDN